MRGKGMEADTEEQRAVHAIVAATPLRRDRARQALVGGTQKQRAGREGVCDTPQASFVARRGRCARSRCERGDYPRQGATPQGTAGTDLPRNGGEDVGDRQAAAIGDRKVSQAGINSAARAGPPSPA